MSDHLVRTIADMERKITEQERQVVELKRSVNVLCSMAGIAPKYDNVTDPTAIGAQSATIKGDQFVNKPLNSAVKDYLSLRRSSGLDGPAAAEEIHSALEQGGFEFESRDKTVAMNSLKISLGKSSHTFKRLPNGKYGLNEWYDIKPRAIKKKTADTPGEEESELTLPMSSDGTSEQTT